MTGTRNNPRNVLVLFLIKRQVDTMSTCRTQQRVNNYNVASCEVIIIYTMKKFVDLLVFPSHTGNLLVFICMTNNRFLWEEESS